MSLQCSQTCTLKARTHQQIRPPSTPQVCATQPCDCAQRVSGDFREDPHELCARLSCMAPTNPRVCQWNCAGVPDGGPNAATLAVGALALGIVGVAGTATFLFYEDYLALAGFWLVLGGGVGYAGFTYINKRTSPGGGATEQGKSM